MGKKKQINGVAVIYTNDGVKLIDADVKRYRSCCRDEDEATYYYNGDDYIFIGCAKTNPPTPADFRYDTLPTPELIPQMINYTKAKTFRLLLDLFRLAQWQPIHKYNCMPNTEPFTQRHKPINAQWVDFSKPVPEIDAQLYQKYGFTPAMIKFVEGNYS